MGKKTSTKEQIGFEGHFQEDTAKGIVTKSSHLT